MPSQSSRPSPTGASGSSAGRPCAESASASTTFSSIPGTSRSPWWRAKPEGTPQGTGLQQVQGLRRAPGPQVRLCHRRALDRRVRLPHRHRDQPGLPFRRPTQLLARLKAAAGLSDQDTARLLTPRYPRPRGPPRYYQEIAIDRTVRAILQGQRRSCSAWPPAPARPWSPFRFAGSSGPRVGIVRATHRKPRILFLADRTILVDDPKDKHFAPFGEARWKIEGGVVRQSRADLLRHLPGPRRGQDPPRALSRIPARISST